MASSPHPSITLYLAVLDVPGMNCTVNARPMNGRGLHLTIRFQGEQPIHLPIPDDRSPFFSWLMDEVERRRIAG